MNRDIIKSLLLDNQHEVEKYQILPRNIAVGDEFNYVFVGVRRAGKSYLMYQKMQERLANGLGWNTMLYLNFEDERLINFQASDFNTLLEVHLELYGQEPVMFLDEIQNIDGWEKFARRMADTGRRVYITGSNAKMLSGEIMSTLGGRYMVIDVYPYNFKEFMEANNIAVNSRTMFTTAGRASVSSALTTYLHGGGFPEGASLGAKRDYLTSLYQKIYLGDIAMRHKIDNAFALRMLFKKVAESIMQPISFNRLAKVIGATGIKVTVPTVIHYLDYACDAWLLTRVYNIAARLAEKESTPKYYFIDNGILALHLINGEAALLENMIAMSLIRRYGRDNEVFYYKNGVEVDFFIPSEGLAVQVSVNVDNSDTFERETRALVALNKHLECKRLIIVTLATEQTVTIANTTIEIIPAAKWLLNI